jgi:hypothetical protein
VKKTKEVVSGYTFDPYIGATLHFGHIPIIHAEEMERTAAGAFVVETINAALADQHTVRHNKYFAETLAGALALAVRIEIELIEVAEQVLVIRPATEEEAAGFEAASQRFLSSMPKVIPETKKKGSRK